MLIILDFLDNFLQIHNNIVVQIQEYKHHQIIKNYQNIHMLIQIHHLQLLMNNKPDYHLFQYILMDYMDMVLDLVIVVYHIHNMILPNYHLLNYLNLQIVIHEYNNHQHLEKILDHELLYQLIHQHHYKHVKTKNHHSLLNHYKYHQLINLVNNFYIHLDL